MCDHSRDLTHTDHYGLVATLRERLALSKQAAQNFYVERFYLRKLNELEVETQCQLKISSRFAALENSGLPGHK